MLRAMASRDWVQNGVILAEKYKEAAPPMPMALTVLKMVQ